METYITPPTAPPVAELAIGAADVMQAALEAAGYTVTDVPGVVDACVWGVTKDELRLSVVIAITP